jgi:hypothetical protein
LLALALGCGALAQPQPVLAQAMTPTEFEDVGSSPKGAVGLGLIGAELGLMLPALVGLHETWAFIVFPVAGGGAGAVAGHFLLDRGLDSPGVSIATLGVGLALVIPTLIATLSWTAYDPERESASRAAGARADAAARPRHAVSGEQGSRLAGATGGLVRWTPRGMRLDVPMLAAVPVYEARDVRQYGLEQRSELRVGVVSGAF